MNRKLNVLIIENDADLRGIIKVSLELDPFILPWVVGSDSDAVALMRRSDTCFDLVLLDDTLPNRAELTSVMPSVNNQIDVHLPIIVLAQASRTAASAGPVEDGVIATIAKPFDPLTLAEDVRDHLLRWERR